MGGRLAAVLLFLALALPALGQEAYVSPYSLEFSLPIASLTADFARPPRNLVEEQSAAPPFARWCDPTAYSKAASWGPLARTYPEPAIPDGVDPLTWRRERLMATAQRYLGYEYQHHHVPDWQPPADWPSRTELRAKGLDCSNFTSWVYNYGLGMKFTSNVGKQAELEAQRLEFPEALETGDLLFIRNREGTRISHVVMWVGDLGRPAGEPLVVDSHGGKVKDSRGAVIPPGVRLRPFREGSWYRRCFSHALRLLPAGNSSGG